jgi:hypothetical protein
VLAGGYYPPIKEIFPINSIRSHLEERQLEVKKNQILLLKVLALWPNVPKFDRASRCIKINGKNCQDLFQIHHLDVKGNIPNQFDKITFRRASIGSKKKIRSCY